MAADRGFGNQRIMFASGPVSGDQTCSPSVTVGYHNGDRGLGSLNFPSFGYPCRQ